MSGRCDSRVICAVEFSDGSNAFVVSMDRPPMPAAPRRIVWHTATSLFVFV
jgi:hypothetical protein